VHYIKCEADVGPLGDIVIFLSVKLT
jgi:hypothetical protein